MKKPKQKPKFAVGQVVRVDTESYRKKWKAQQYQKIVRRFSWDECKSSPYGYVLANNDRCNERFLQPLTVKERGWLPNTHHLPAGAN
jgi:hypothetical protein